VLDSPLNKFPLNQRDVTEAEALEFFHRCRRHRHPGVCPRCGHRKLREIRRQRFFCPTCHYEFGDFTGTYLARLHIGFKGWLELLEFFLQEWPARQAAPELGLSYPTVYRGFQLIRIAIATQDQDFPSEGNGGNGASSGGGNHDQLRQDPQVIGPVCGIEERAGRVQVEVLPALPVKELAGLKIRQMGRSRIVYTSRYKDYDSLMFCLAGEPGVDFGLGAGPITRRVNRLPGFRGYARARFVKLRGISRKKFPLYLQELAFRYNHPDIAHSFKIIAGYLTQPLAESL
jgi:transposase